MLTRDNFINNTIFSSRVKRYHTWAVHHQETVGEHSHRVIILYTILFGPPSREALLYMAAHDMPELGVGDPPYPVKANNDTLKSIYDDLEKEWWNKVVKRHPNLSCYVDPKLDKMEKLKVKLADMIQMMEFAAVEISMGNKLALPVYYTVKDHVLEVLKKSQLEIEERLNIISHCNHLEYEFIGEGE